MTASFLALALRFQSTLPRRERLVSPPPYSVFCIISIHAPAKGATRVCTSSTATAPNFNPRSREGSDGITDMEKLVGKKFQSTLPRRERRPGVRHAEKPEHFNPRSREGSD